jgi:uncharacterized protein YwqG
MNKEEFFTILQNNELGKYLNKLEPVLKNTLRLYQTPCKENEIKLGQSKIGGRPDLPSSIQWIMETNAVVTDSILTEDKRFINVEETNVKPLSFIAQINLTEVSQFDSENLLPKSGILYFFYSADQQAWGTEYKDKNKFKVLFYEGQLSELKRMAFPPDLCESSRYKACKVNAKPEISLPPYGHEVYNDFTEEENEIFWEHVDETDEINKMLGYPDIIQNEMELECELVTNERYPGDSLYNNDHTEEELELKAKNWQLLLQIDSNEQNEMMWGDCGRLYFWIKRNELKSKLFDNAWFILQCS